MAKLGEVCTIVSGSTPKTSVTSYWDGNIKWITPAELNEDTFYIMDSVRHITEEGKEKTGLSYLPTGTVILSSRAPIGKTAIAGCEMCCNQGFKNLICSDAFYNEYLYFFLKSKTDYLNSLGRGATFKEISKSIVENIEIPLPEVNQQKEIAEKFKKLEQLISLRKQQLAKLDELVKARFVEMFGEPINNPMKWIVSKIEDIAAQEKNALKAGPFGSALKKEFYVKSGYKIYGQEQVICGDASFGDYYIDEEKYKELKNCAVQAGDILISLVGTYGKALIMPDNYEAGIINPRLMKITLNKNKVKPIYFKYYFESDALKASMDANTHGGTMGILNLGIIRQMKIQVPPLSLQNQFAAFVERVDKQKQTVQQSLEKLELMKKALMQEYFG